MLEALIAALGFGALAALALIVLYVPPYLIAWIAGSLTIVGFALGVPTGLYYHVVLRRELARLGPLPARWYVAPQKHHHRLDDAALHRVTRWFYIGGFGFALIMLGATLTLVALFTLR